MTCGEFLKVLQQNPEKELEFIRIYNSGNNGKLSSYGNRTIQKLGKLQKDTKPNKENKITIIINQYL